MSSTGIALLGALAGFTIFLGLPVGRLRATSVAARATLNAVATGILLFLFVDVLGHALNTVEDALVAATGPDTGSWWDFWGLAALAVAGVTVGLMGLIGFESWIGRRSAVTSDRYGPGAASTAELDTRTRTALRSTGGRLALLIAVGIGLHNFAEGLAIGQSAAAGELSLALLLIIGFGLHNATEGFGVVAPLTGEPQRPTWATLALLGLIAGAPTFIGTVLGQVFVNNALSVAFLALAAGSILYVVMQLLRTAERLGHRRLLGWGILSGLFLGVATDMIIVAAGA